MTTKTTQTLCVVDSWLNAVSIPHEITENPPAIAVKATNGSEIVFNLENDDSIQNVLSRDYEKALGQFHQITSKAGYGTPNPSSRPVAKQKQIRNDIDLSIARHSEFRKAPDLPKEVLDSYNKVIKIAIYKFYSKNFTLLKQLGYEKDDLYSYALIWTHNFHHKYRLPFGTQAQNNNYLAQHLNQRFFNALTFLKRQFDGTFLEENDVNLFLVPEANHDLDDYLETLPVAAALDKLENLIKSGTLDKSTEALARTKIQQLTT